MKISKKQLKQIIKEELGKLIDRPPLKVIDKTDDPSDPAGYDPDDIFGLIDKYTNPDDPNSLFNKIKEIFPAIKDPLGNPSYNDEDLNDVLHKFINDDRTGFDIDRLGEIGRTRAKWGPGLLWDMIRNDTFDGPRPLHDVVRNAMIDIEDELQGKEQEFQEIERKNNGREKNKTRF